MKKRVHGFSRISTEGKPKNLPRSFTEKNLLFVIFSLLPVNIIKADWEWAWLLFIIIWQMS